MRTTLFSTLALVAILASSCQREYILEDLDNPLPVDSTQTDDPDSLSSDYEGLLTKIISYDKTDDGVDSLIANYVYDGQNRLIEFNSYSKNLENPTPDNYIHLFKMTREPGGIIKKITVLTILRETPDDTEPLDDVTYEFHYDQSLLRYTYAIMTGFEESVYYRDSIVYEYNNDNKIIKKITYGYNAINEPNKQILDITYDSKGNVIRRRKFFEHENNVSESFDITYNYDDKAAPGNFGELTSLLFEEFDNIFPTGENNITGGEDRLDRTGLPDIVYSYNSFGKPAKATYTYKDSDDRGEVIYFYKKR